MKNINSFEELKKHSVIKTHNDVFNNELIIKSEHLRYKYCDIAIHKDVPLDVIYKSNSSGEKVFIIFESYFQYNNRLSLVFVDKIVFNIDGKKNIEITKKENPPTEDECYELTKEQLTELCNANSLKIQISGYDGVLWEGAADSFITILQALYNEAFDNTMFKNAKAEINSQIIKKGEEEGKLKKQKRNLFCTSIISLIITIAAILGACFSPWWIFFTILASVAFIASIIFLLWGIIKDE